MLVIEIRFLTGRYHATAWGRNVNEGVPEWPPSPYRLLRALVDAWKRKRAMWPDSRVEPLLAALSSGSPDIHLPPANSGHIRSFLSANRLNPLEKQKIFDAFVTLSPEEPVLFHWESVSLPAPQLADLNELLEQLNYLGRSESWVFARALDACEGKHWNCLPAERSGSIQGGVEPVRVACPVSKAEYSLKPALKTGKGAKEALTWLDAIGFTTAELHKKKMSEPPAMRFFVYNRPYPAFQVVPVPRDLRNRKPVNGILYALDSKILPHVATTLELSERIRRKLMGIHKRIVGDPSRVSRTFSGKDTSGKPLKEHGHTYYLPMDSDGDGRLDHLLVYSRTPLERTEIKALEALTRIWQSGGKPDIVLIPLKWGTQKELLAPATVLTSATPFIPTHHYRKGRGEYGEWLASEVRRELANTGLPEPVRVTPVLSLEGKARTVRWLEFRRNRKGETPSIGFGFRIEFGAPVNGPVSIGYGAHFGLGLFVPEMESKLDRPGAIPKTVIEKE